MSLLRQLLPQRTSEQRSRVPIDWPSLLAGGPVTSSGVIVTPESAARSAAVTGCQRVLTASVASLPIDVILERGGTRRRVERLPSIVANPAATVRRRAFVAQLMKSLLNDGNAYAEIVDWDPAGRARQMETRHYKDVVWRKDADGRLRPHIKNEPVDLWPIGPLLHLPATPFMQPGSPVADSPVDLAMEAIGTGLAAERFGGRFFADGGRGSDIVYADAEITPEQAQIIKQRILASRTGTREPAVLGAGLKVEHEVVDTKDSQFIDLLRFEVEQACRFFGVPPSMVYAAISGQSVTYANVSQADLQYLKHSLGSWLLDLEDPWSELLTAPQRVRFNVDGLLRMDAKERHGVYETRLKNRTMSINEVRALEDEEPFAEEFDEPGIPGTNENARSLSAAEVAQKVYLAVDSGVLTVEEARELIAEAGAQLDPEQVPGSGTDDEEGTTP